MIQAVLFDMDGLMFDTERLWGTFWAPALAEFGLPYREGLAQAARGTAGETLRGVLHSYYGPDCPAEAILDRFHQLAVETFRKPVPKKPGLDELLAWLDEKGVPMAVVSSSSEAVIRRNLDNWGLGRYFKAVVAGEMVGHSKPDPEAFLLGAAKLGAEPARCLVLEDSHNGVRAGAAGGFVTVMVPDLMPVTDEMRGLFTAQCASLFEVLDKLKAGEF